MQSFVLAIAAMLSVVASPQSTRPTTTSKDVVSVRIPVAVLADRKPLPAGLYSLRLTGEQPSQPGQPPGAQEIVEILAGGNVVARETAEVLRDEALPAVGASSVSVQSGTRVEMLKGGEFLRISMKRDGARYLVYLPIAVGKETEPR